MPSNYTEIIQFNNQVGGVKVKQKGIRISNDLCISYASPYSSEKKFRIFSIVSGKPVIPLDFNDLDQAKEFAEWLQETYKDFWPLLSEYPEMNIPQVCMWTVTNGIRTVVALSSLEGKDTITLADLERAREMAKDEVDNYVRFPRKT